MRIRIREYRISYTHIRFPIGSLLVKKRRFYISEVLPWEPLHGQRKLGWPRKTYTAQLRYDNDHHILIHVKLT